MSVDETDNSLSDSTPFLTKLTSTHAIIDSKVMSSSLYMITPWSACLDAALGLYIVIPLRIDNSPAPCAQKLGHLLQLHLQLQFVPAYDSSCVRLHSAVCHV